MISQMCNRTRPSFTAPYGRGETGGVRRQTGWLPQSARAARRRPGAAGPLRPVATVSVFPSMLFAWGNPIAVELTDPLVFVALEFRARLDRSDSDD